MKNRLSELGYKIVSNQNLIAQLEEKIETLEEQYKKNNYFYAAAINEIRNPLFSILGSIELLIKSKKSLNAFQIELIKNA